MGTRKGGLTGAVQGRTCATVHMRFGWGRRDATDCAAAHGKPSILAQVSPPLFPFGRYNLA